MGKKIYEDKEEWKKALKKNYVSLNMLYDDKQKMKDQQMDAKIDEFMKNPKLFENYQKAQLLKENNLKAHKIVNDFVKEFELKHGKDSAHNFNGYGTFIFSKIKTEDTDEARKYNEKLLYSMTNEEYAKRQYIKDYKKALEFDFNKLIVKDPSELLDVYANNREECEFLFSVARVTDQQKPSREMLELHYHVKSMMETCNIQTLLNYYTNDIIFTYPEVDDKVKNAGAMMAFMENNKEYEGKYDGFIAENKGMNATMMFGGEVTTYITMKENFAKFAELKEKGVDLNGFLMKYKVLNKDGSKAKTANMIMDNTDEVKWEKTSKEEKEALVKTIDNCHNLTKTAENYNPENDTYMDQYSIDKRHQQLKGLYEDLKKTDHWYNWFNTRKFKDMRDCLARINSKVAYNDPESFKKDLADLTKATESYYNKKATENRNANGNTRFAIAKYTLDLTKELNNSTFYTNFDNSPRLVSENEINTLVDGNDNELSKERIEVLEDDNIITTNTKALGE